MPRRSWPLQGPQTRVGEFGFQSLYALLHLAAIVFHVLAVLHHGYRAVHTMRRQHPLNWTDYDNEPPAR